MTDRRGDEKRERKKRMVRKKRNGAVLKRRKGRENIGEIDLGPVHNQWLKP